MEYGVNKYVLQEILEDLWGRPAEIINQNA